MNLVITEIFHSLQGEGPLIGTPSVFIRLGGCIEPLCPWCDTAYAWHDFSEMDILEVIREVERYTCRDVVITGGEPLLQWDAGLSALHEQLARKGFRMFYETSGKAGIPDIHNATIVLSPKHLEGTWQVDRDTLMKADWLKFVAFDQASLEEIDRFVNENALKKDTVFIMPAGRTREEQLALMGPVFSFCLDRGYRMTPRLHVLVFDDRRGV